MNAEKKSKGFECKHAIYVTANNQTPNDLVFVKEVEHFTDGTTVPRTRLLRNHKRDFWITKEELRNHQEKREWADMREVRKFSSTQFALADTISRALGRGTPKDRRLSVVCRSPYVYGADVTTPVLVKHHYMKSWPDNITVNTIAALDTETDMETEEIIMLSITCKTRARLIVVKSFLKGIEDPIAAIRQAAEHYIGDVLKERNIELEIMLADNAGHCAVLGVEAAHAWKPDFMAIWNMDFDIPKMMDAMIKYGYDPTEVWPDPSVPKEFRHANYIQGQKQKRTASGDVTPLHPAEQWHRLETPASFYVIDPMCVYLKLRIAKGKESSYALDSILEKHGVKGKLKFSEADHLSKGAWHVFMQKNYRLEYCIYNLYDSIALELLDEKTTDLGQQISSLCGHSEYHRFPSQPRRLCDDLHFFGLERNRVIGTTSDKMEIEIDKGVVGLTDWIVTLPSWAIAPDEGLNCVAEMPEYHSMLFGHVADLDVEGTYPNEEILMNISRETTMMEVVGIQGIGDNLRRAIGVNMSSGAVNAVEISEILYRAPALEDVVSIYEYSRGEIGRDQIDAMLARVSRMATDITLVSTAEEEAEEV